MTNFDNNAMEYTYLGKSGLKVSKIILGCMSFGSTDWQPWVLNEEESLPLINEAWEKGINTWDTANVYSNGESERILRKAIDKYKIPRNQLVICTKAFAPIGPTPELTHGKDVSRDPFYINHHGLSRAALFNAVDASLERLGMNYIDLFGFIVVTKRFQKRKQ